MFFGTFTEVASAIERALTIARDVGITFSEIPEGPSTKVRFHGIDIDFAQKTVSMAEKAQTKMSRYASFLTSIASKSSSHIVHLPILSGDEPLLKIIGTAMFWSRLMFQGSFFAAGDMAQHFQVMQLVRAISRASFEGEESFPCNRGALNRLLGWLQNIPRTIAPPARSNQCAVITTDACVTGGGYVIQQAIDMTHMAFPWRKRVEPRDMGKFELRSIAIAIVNSGLHNQPIKLYTDSTIAIGALLKGYSPSRQINDEVRRILAECRRRGTWIQEIHYVNTNVNIADVLSRAVATNESFDISSSLPTTWVWDSVQYGFRLDTEGHDMVIEMIEQQGPSAKLAV